MSDLPTIISDEKQRDPKSRTYAEDMGITRHERQHFPMGVRLPDVAPDEVMVERLVNDIKNRAVHSYKTSTSPRGRTVKVTVSEYTIHDLILVTDAPDFSWGSSKVFEWEVRERGVILRTGFALHFADGKTILWDTSSPIGEKPV
jgi:hypothetical protein